MNKLTPQFVDEVREQVLKTGKFENEIIKRIDYIMKSVFNLFDEEDAYWYFYGASEGEIGDLWSSFHENSSFQENYVSIIVDDCSGESMVILLKDGSRWGLNDGIPTRWLFEDFEQELIEGKKNYKEKEIRQKEEAKIKIKNQKEKDLNLVNSAKRKLSKEELAALKKALKQ